MADLSPFRDDYKKRWERWKRDLHDEPCQACGFEGPVEIHHIRTRGSGGIDAPWNLIVLCRTDHTRWHAMGPIKFLARHPDLFEYLSRCQWYFDASNKFRCHLPVTDAQLQRWLKDKK